LKFANARTPMPGINTSSSVSYTKDEVLMPGIGVRAFANFKF